LNIDTRNAIIAFHKHAALPQIDNLLSPGFCSALLNTTPDALFPMRTDIPPGTDLSTALAKRILRYMTQKGYWIARAPDMFNIVYVEGINGDGKTNPDHANEWNDRRMVIRIGGGGQPELLVNDQATTEPGRYFTQDPLNPLGAARIAFGQYKAWVDGLHKGHQPALVQTERLRIHRDLNKNGLRDASDPIEIGSMFGINQHSTSETLVPSFVDKFSAGCLVGRRYRWHLSFLQIVRQDFRYAGNKGYVFMSTVINGDELARVEGG
jgi:hypothetical protein